MICHECGKEITDVYFKVILSDETMRLMNNTLEKEYIICLDCALGDKHDPKKQATKAKRSYNN